MNKRSKLQDVADLAGVSIGTASRVFNNKPNVMPETRARVLSAAEQLAYYHTGGAVPSVPATQATIGVISSLIPGEYAVSTSFHGNVLAGVDMECREQQIKLFYATFTRTAYLTPTAWPLPLHDPDIDGLILTGGIPEHVIDQVCDHTGKPIVLIDAYASGYDMVLADNVLGGYRAVRYLIEQGHRHIGLIGTQPGAFQSFLHRREGYLRALRDYGITDTYIGESSHLIDATYDATQLLLKQHPQITAIFFCLDLVANSVIQAVHDLGLDVPGDISVIGFDDLPFAAQTAPPLTTMRVDIPLMGRFGVRQLLKRINNPQYVSTKILLRPQLVIRDSVRSLLPA